MACAVNEKSYRFAITDPMTVLAFALAIFFLTPSFSLSCPTCGVDGLSEDQLKGYYLSYLLLIGAPFGLVAFMGGRILKIYNPLAYRSIMGRLGFYGWTKWIYLSIVLLGVGSVFFFSETSKNRIETFPLPRSLLVGQADLAGGGPISSEGLNDRVVLVNFFASWCLPCQEEVPDLADLHHEFGSSGLKVIGITYDLEHEGELVGVSNHSLEDKHNIRSDARQMLLGFLQFSGVEYPVIPNTEEIESSFGGIEGMPITFLFRRDGRLVKKYWGAPSSDVLRDDIRSLL